MCCIYMIEIKCINVLTLGSFIRFMTMRICFPDLENPGIDALFI